MIQRHVMSSEQASEQASKMHNVTNNENMKKNPLQTGN